MRVANDANCFAVSEATDGAAAGADVVFGVIVGPGTGAGITVPATGDPGAEATMSSYERRMARALAGVINLLDPDVIVLGGGLSNIDRLYEHVPRLWSTYVFSAGVRHGAAFPVGAKVLASKRSEAPGQVQETTMPSSGRRNHDPPIPV